MSDCSRVFAILTGRPVALASSAGAAASWTAMSEPVAGTLPTVLEDFSREVSRRVSAGSRDIQTILFHGLERARESLANTPNQLPALKQAADDANSHIRQVAAEQIQYAGMGSTLSGICLMGGRYWVVNAGDSRVYRYRNGVLKPLSNDDTLAARAVRSGAMTFEQAARSRDSHILTNYLGAAEFSLAVDSGPELRDGDSLLVCSDVLYDMVDDDTLARCLQQFNATAVSCAEQAGHLLALANECGGLDNISLILMRVTNERG